MQTLRCHTPGPAAAAAAENNSILIIDLKIWNYIVFIISFYYNNNTHLLYTWKNISWKYDPTTLHIICTLDWLKTYFMKLWPDNTSHHLKYIYDMLTGYFYQSFTKSLSQHIWKKATRVRNNSAEYEDDQHTRAGRVTSTTLPVGLKTQGTRDINALAKDSGSSVHTTY